MKNVISFGSFKIKKFLMPTYLFVILVLHSTHNFNIFELVEQLDNLGITMTESTVLTYVGIYLSILNLI
jgi:hypothetical protein